MPQSERNNVFGHVQKSYIGFSRGRFDGFATLVLDGGVVYVSGISVGGISVGYNDGGVRPALWLNL